VIGDRVLIGSRQIPEEFPGLIEEYLSEGGVDYPALLPLAPVLPERDAEEETGRSQDIETEPTAGAPRSNGFSLAIAILVGMLAALGYSMFVFIHSKEHGNSRRSQLLFEWAVPLLALAGLGVAGYLAYVETQAVSALCGPVGDCNVVQSSPYARLFGVLPVGVLGLAGYLGILLAWAWRRLRPSGLGRHAPTAIFAMALFGTLFSIYLTYLEPFVIRAVCTWCLTSAVLITLLLLVSVRPAIQGLEKQKERA
jgi:uncharacterized membrane protein